METKLEGEDQLERALEAVEIFIEKAAGIYLAVSIADFSDKQKIVGGIFRDRL